MKIILILFFCIFQLHVYAQDAASAIIEKVNAQLLSIEKGEYSVIYKSKSPLNSDTAVGNGRVQYFKTPDIPGDSIARFVFWSNKTSPRGFDGRLFWSINNKQKEVVSFDVARKKGIQDYISHYDSERTKLLSVPILTDKGYQPLNPDDFKGWSVRPVNLNDTLFIAIEKSALEPNLQKLTPTDGDSLIFTQQWLFYPNIYSRGEEIVKMV
jgi:hypothetical protein